MWSVMAFETGTLLLAAVLFLPGLQAVVCGGRFERTAAGGSAGLCVCTDTGAPVRKNARPKQ